MKKLLSVAAIVLCLVAVSVNAANFNEYYIKFKLDSREMLDEISGIVSIDNVKDGEVYAYANDDELAKFERLGIPYERLQRPSTLIQPEMFTFEKGVWDFDTYPTYTTYLDMMDSFAVAFPNLCVLETAGTTVEGREIVFAKISDNVNVEEDEPEVMYTSSIHGDETTGYVLTLRLISYLLNNYGVDSLVTRLVDSCEIYINPLGNPDGTYAGGNSSVYGATRYNANGYDLNRNFPDPDDGPNPNGPTQQETQVMMDFASAHSFVISANYHGGAEVVNYPWDTWSMLHPDDTWWREVSHVFADSAQVNSPSGYMDGFNDGITNGYAWYTISGGRQDYMNYYQGCREVTIEISGTKLLPASQLPSHWNYLRNSFLNYLENALYGIRGVVTDLNTGLPVAATITLQGHDAYGSYVYTDPDAGDYHRMINPGTYNMVVTADGYYDYNVGNVTVGGYDETVRIDVAMEPLPYVPEIAYVSNDLALVDPGDNNVPMNVTLINNGIAPANNVTCDLSTSDTYITINTASAAYPDIPANGGTGTSLTDFVFSVDPSCPANHSVRFYIHAYADGGYDDIFNFYVTVGQTVENFESGDYSMMDWQMAGDAPWSTVTTEAYEGSYSSKSGLISDHDTTEMSITVDVVSAGDISFHYKVSSEDRYDWLRFYIDGVQQDRWAGIIDWTEASFPVTPGTRTFTWRYTKDVNTSEGEDCAWVDLVVFPQLDLGFEIATPALPDWTAGEPFSVQLQASGGTAPLTWTDNNNGLDGTGLILSTSGLISGTPAAPGTINLEVYVEDQASNSDLKNYSFDIAPALNITTTTVPSATVGQPYSETLIAAGGTGAKTWADKNGNLASYGLTLATNGIISGTPTGTGNVEFIAEVDDAIGATVENPFTLSILEACMCGDMNGDDKIDLLDILHLIDYKFKEGPAPVNPMCSDVNNDGDVNLLDILVLIDYKFKEGSAPDCGLVPSK